MTGLVRNVSRSKRIGAVLLAFALFATGQQAIADATFATVGEQRISYEEFEREVNTAARQTYYHGRPPDDSAFLEFRRGVADQLVDRHLLMQEASRRGITVDRAAIDAQLEQYRRRYGSTPRWQVEGDRMLASVAERLEQNALLEALETQVRRARVPTEAEVAAYYAEYPARFTEPPRNRVSVILLAVAPSATPDVWAVARKEAAGIVRRLGDGAEFSELARIHSADRSATNGGDMGYLHEGMLSPAAEEALATLEIGETSQPVTVLEGVAIFHLADRTNAFQRPLADVRKRAADLWARDEGESQWESLLTRLRDSSRISVDLEYLASLPERRR